MYNRYTLPVCFQLYCAMCVCVCVFGWDGANVTGCKLLSLPNVWQWKGAAGKETHSLIYTHFPYGPSLHLVPPATPTPLRPLVWPSGSRGTLAASVGCQYFTSYLHSLAVVAFVQPHCPLGPGEEQLERWQNAWLRDLHKLQGSD